MLDGCPMLQLLVLVAVVAVVCRADVDLAVGRPSLQSRTVSVSSDCSTPSNLNVDANVTGVVDSDCSCTITNGTWPPATRDWHLIQLSSQSLVRSVRVSGHATGLEVLVGDEFNSNPDVSSFSLCTGYNPSDSGRLLACTSPMIGSVVALRALDNDTSLRLCRIEVLGLSGNLLHAISTLTASLNLAVNDDQQLLLTDGDESTCIAVPASSNATLQLSVPYRVNDSLVVRLMVKDVSLPVLRFDASSLVSGLRGRACMLTRTTTTPSSMEFLCTCPKGCRGKLSISLGNVPSDRGWNMCEVIAIVPESEEMKTANECQSPMAPLGLAATDGRFADGAWSSSAGSDCPPIGQLNYVAPAATDTQAWCAQPATAGSWIAINLGTLFKVRAIVLQGAGTAGPAAFSGSYVTAFKVSYAFGATQWVYYTENGAVAVLTGPSHHTTPVLRAFQPELMASRVRVEVIQWNKNPCLRMELIGCRMVADEWRGSLMQAISGADGVPNSALSESSEFNAYHNVKRSRITSSYMCNWVDAFVLTASDVDPWMQVDLGKTRTVQGMFWGGRYGSWVQYIRTFTLQVRRRPSDPWTPYSSTPLSTGLADWTLSPVYSHLLSPFDAQLVKVVPVTYTNYRSLRFDLAVSPLTPPIISTPLDECSGEYRSLSGYGCYRYVNRSMNYTEAEQFCSSDGAHLARVTDYDEWNTVLSVIPRLNSTALNRARLQSASQPWQYMGCFADQATRDLDGINPVASSSMSTEYCAQLCLEAGDFKYFGTQGAFWCLCGNRLGLYGKLAESQCSDLCVGNNALKCGGAYINSAYSFARTWSANPHSEWTQRGCFLQSDVNGFERPAPQPSLVSVEVCFNVCTSRGMYKYFALQSGSVCSCGSSFAPSTLSNQSQCSSTCNGDPSETCGGSTASSVYEITYLAASCVWIGGHSSGSDSTYRLPTTGASLDVWKAGFPLRAVNTSSSSGLCLEQKADYSVSALQDAEKRHFICEKDVATQPPTPAGLWPFNVLHGLRDLSSNRQHAVAGSSVSFSGTSFDPQQGVYVSNDYMFFDDTANAFVDIQLRESVDVSSRLTLLLDCYISNSGLVVAFLGSSGAKLVGLSYSGGSLLVELPRSRDQMKFSASPAMTANSAHLVGLTYDSNSGVGRVFIDDVLVSTLSLGAGERLGVSSRLRLGYHSLYSNDPLWGYLRCVQLYDRVLRGHEMTNARRRCRPSTTQGLLGLWPLHDHLRNLLHRGLPSVLSDLRFVAGPPMRRSLSVNAVRTSASSSLSVPGPLNVDGSFAVLMHVKMANATNGTLLSLRRNGTTGLTLNATGSSLVLTASSSTLGSGQCAMDDRWTQVALRLDASSSTLALFCNASVVVSLTVTAAQLQVLRQLVSLEVGMGMSLSVSCLMLFDRFVTDLEVSSYLFYCPFRADDTFGKRSLPKRHCGEWLRSGLTASGIYMVDPDGTDGLLEPFAVFCNMTDSSDQMRGATLVRHSIADRTGVPAAPSALSASFDVTYEASMEQMLALMAVAAHCKQMLVYECSTSAIYTGSIQNTGWYSRQLALQPGWAGVPSGASGCVCSRQGTCAGGATAKCNCDKRDATLRTDAGWITDMNLLPVGKLAFGDATAGSNFVTLGSLICYG